MKNLDEGILVNGVECTAAENCTCQIVDKLPIMNKLAPGLLEYVSGALQRVLLYPALLVEVLELLKIYKDELINSIRDRLRMAETFDGLLKLTRVVKQKVVCHSSDDGSAQLNA
ncbi:hypothetical protein MRX96_008661 [Rhipicephalus microplus]